MFSPPQCICKGKTFYPTANKRIFHNIVLTVVLFNIYHIFCNFRKYPVCLDVWLWMTSFYPVLFLAVLMFRLLHGDFIKLAQFMVSNGLEFIIIIFFMHLMISYAREMSKAKNKKLFKKNRSYSAVNNV